jgi:hypothetical protein
MASPPRSPVSNSTAFQSQRADTVDESDESLTTPRPGPQDPADRTEGNLSRPAILVQDPLERKSSPESVRTAHRTPSPAKENRTATFEIGAGSFKANTKNYGISPSRSESGAALGTSLSERQKSVSFSSAASLPKPERKSSYSMAGRWRSPAVSPHSEMRNRGQGAAEETGESSADENTAIIRRRLSRQQYGTSAPDDEDDLRDDGHVDHDAVYERSDSPNKRRNTATKSRSRRSINASGRGQDGSNYDESKDEHVTWWRSFLDKYGSIELENKGSVARDHLALGSCDTVSRQLFSTLIGPSRTDIPCLASNVIVFCQHWHSSDTAVPSQHFHCQIRAV